MEYNKPICDFAAGDQVEGCYVLKSAQGRTTASGKPFLAAVLMDRSGAIEAKVWDYSGPCLCRRRGKRGEGPGLCVGVPGGAAAVR